MAEVAETFVRELRSHPRFAQSADTQGPPASLREAGKV